MSVPYGRPPVTYAQGRWVALLADEVALIAEVPADSAVLGACWTAMIHGAGVDGVLGALTQVGATTIANFALVGPAADGGTRLVVSGTALLEISGPQHEPSTVIATEAGRADERVPGRPAVRLVGAADDADRGVALPLDRGVVRASAVGLGTSAVGTSIPEAPVAAPEPVPAPEPSAAPEPVPAPEPSAAPEPAPAARPDVAAFAPPAVPPSAPAPPVEPAPAAPPASTQALPPVVESVAPPVVERPAAPEPEPAPEPAPEPLSEPAPPAPQPIRVSSDTMPPRSDFDSGLIDSLPWRTPDSFGDAPADPTPAEPVAPPVAPAPTPGPSWGDPHADYQDPNALNPWAGAAPPAWPEPAAAPPAWPVPGTPPGGNWGAPEGDAPDYGWPAPPSSPWAPGGAEPAAPEPVAAPPVAETGGPVVHAFACPNQHLNPPYAGNCRICGEPIPQQEGFAAPRPQLGVLTLSTGDTVPLDRDVVLGRAPFHADENAASRPHLVQLSSPGNDISRSHVRVNLENWFVQVTDLGSTNGTVVTLPDQAPVRLRPHDPFTILPGTTVNIADEVTLRFDAS